MIKGLFIFLFISTPVYSMTVDAFIFADTIIEASNMPNTSLTDKEKVEVSEKTDQKRYNEHLFDNKRQFNSVSYEL